MTRALLLPGLNNGPGAMEPIAAELTRRGFDVRRGHLTGHFESEHRLARFRAVDAETWLRDAREFVERERGERTVFVGYSLGGLLGLSFDFAECLLFAPALALRRWSYLPGWLRGLDFVVPSAMPRELRANRGTPTRAYGALNDLVARFSFAAEPPPTTVVMSPYDEMVDYARVREWTSRHGATLIDARVRGRQHWVLDPALIPASFMP